MVLSNITVSKTTSASRASGGRRIFGNFDALIEHFDYI